MLFITGVVGVLNTASLLASMYVAVRLITAPVIMKYANDNMAAMLLVPAAGCGAIGFYLFTHAHYSHHHSWIASVFTGAACATVVNSWLGLVGGRYKLRYVLKSYIAISAFIMLCLCAMGTTCYVFSTLLGDEMVYTHSAKRIACQAKFTGCCCCRSSAAPDPCPEWETSEVISLVASDFRIAALTALLSVVYEFGGLVTGYLLHENLKSYRCEYL